MKLMNIVSNFLLLSICLTFLRSVEGHGRLIVPPSRSSMWRYGFNTPTNYQDNELYCGGFTYQWQTNGGKCGICGDPYDGVRENEAGGKYATGTISRTYQQGALIEVSVQITAHHMGWFEFRLCPNNNPQVAATPDCLNQNLLALSDGTTRHTLPQTSKSGDIHKVKLQLPTSLTCTQCVFQWKYHTGNSWGCDSNGCAVGNGPQEEFYGCADITILSTGATSGTTSTAKSTSASSDKTTTSGTTTVHASSTPVSTTTVGGSASTTKASTTTETTTMTTKTTTTQPAQGKVCKSAGAWEGQSSMDTWCEDNCAVGNCPATHCKCETVTAAATTPTTTTTTTKPASVGSTTTETTTTTIHADSSTTQEITTKNVKCTTYKSINGSLFEDKVCEYSCLIENSCPKDQCMCSTTSQPTVQIKNCQGPSGVDNADRYCTVMCTYDVCPSECQC